MKPTTTRESDLAVEVEPGRRPTPRVRAAAFAAAAVLCAMPGCDDPVDPPRPTTVTVTPATAELTALESTVRFRAEIRDQHGKVMDLSSAVWSSGDTDVATVQQSGLATATGNGTATITATVESVEGTAEVTVEQRPAEVRVTPAADTLLAFGDTLRLSAEARDANGHAIADAEIAWASGDTAVATVDSAGLVTGISPGEVEVTATSAGAAGRARLDVMVPVPVSVSVSPDTVSFDALQRTVRLAAEVRDRAGRVMDEEPVTWASGDTLVATVDSAGLVTAAANGKATVTATAGEATGSAAVTVEQVVRAVEVTPSSDTVAFGDTLRLAAEGFDANGHSVAGVEFSWSSDDGSVATVDASGLVKGMAEEGVATITADAGGVRGAAEIRVVNPDLLTLTALYNATDGPNWVDSENWLTDAPLGEWYGVSTDGSGRVVGLGLEGKWDDEANTYVSHGLTGGIPPELGDLANLESLNLRVNDLTGGIPPELGDLANLVALNLGANGLTGGIPPELGDLANLESLNLGANDLTGGIPPELGDLASLESLNLGGNDLTGGIPPELGDLANLVILDLYDNGLTGAIPPELGDLANLVALNLGGNGLTGAIPPELGDLANLWSLLLSFNDLAGGIPPELGDLASLVVLDLYDNGLTGAIPPELGDLANLEDLYLSLNGLTGTLPRAFLDSPLQRLELSEVGVCVPGTSEFVDWVEGLEYWELSWCNEPDRVALAGLHEMTGGQEWTESDGWLDSQVLEEWHGVRTDSLGRAVVLGLGDNGLSGVLPGIIGFALPRLTELRVDGNRLVGRLPNSLTRLDLREFHFDDTDLCEPADDGFQRWLDGIESLRRTGVECSPPTDRDALVALYGVAGGHGWHENENWLTDEPLRLWHGVEVDDSDRVVALDLYDNNLTSGIPPELGDLASLQYLDLGENYLTGHIPPEVGGLANLEWLNLGWSGVTGGIPPELGDLANLESLNLSFNGLTGRIPPELGGLANLESLNLSFNGLTGQIPPELADLAELKSLELSGSGLTGRIPPELADLAELERLDLQANGLTGRIPPELGELNGLRALLLGANDLSGTIPREIGGLANLTRLELATNGEMSGALPSDLTDLPIDTLVAGGTDLCAPRTAAFSDWLGAMSRSWIARCGDAAAYLVQVVQSRSHAVPLVAGEKALLRVFVTAAKETEEGIPPVRAIFFVDGDETHRVDIPAKSTPIPTEVDEGKLSKSANVEIPGRIVEPGLEMVIEIDPDGTLDDDLGVPKRIPEEGRMAVEVRKMPDLDLTAVPFLWTEDPDSAILDAVDDMEDDPDGDDLLEDTRILLPVVGIGVVAHEAVASTSNDAIDLLLETEAIRVLEGGDGHYVGMMSGSVTSGAGVAFAPGRSSFSVPDAGVLAHELGHNMSLEHAPCGSPAWPDPLFPDRRGRIGAWGYDFRSGRVVAPHKPDLMSYCSPQWIGGYHFGNALRHRLSDEGEPGAPEPSLLLWGGVDPDGDPFLNPAFVADAPAALPDSAGAYTVTGWDAGGGVLFSLSFAMPVVQSEREAGSAFVVALPVRPGWAGALAAVALSGPGDASATLDADSDRPMAILIDRHTRRVRAVLRNVPAPPAVGDGMEVLFSRGIPEAGEWRR